MKAVKTTLRKRRPGKPEIIQIAKGQDSKNEYKMMLAKKQGFICPVCKRDFSKDETKTLHLDHNHKNGMIRETLCGG